MLARVSRRVFVASAAAAAVARPVRSQELATLRIACANTDNSTPTIYALRSDLFRRAGLNVELQQMSSGAAMAAAVAGGALQIGEHNMTGLSVAHLHGIPFQILAAGHVYATGTPTEVLVVRRDSAIRSARDLNGKTLGSPALGDLFALTAAAWVDANGGDAKTTRAVEIPRSATIAAIQTGRIDAATIDEPILSAGLTSGTFRILGKPYDLIAKRFLVAVNIATADFVAANRDVARRYATVMREANAYANTHRAETAPLIASWTGLDPATIQHMTRETFADTVDAADIQPVIDALVRFKLIEHAFDAHELISPVALSSPR